MYICNIITYKVIRSITKSKAPFNRGAFLIYKIMMTINESVELHSQLFFNLCKSKKQSIILSLVYHLIFFTAMCLLFSCSPESDNNNCDSELQELEQRLNETRGYCNGSSTCISKLNQDYEKEKQEIIDKCN